MQRVLLVLICFCSFLANAADTELKLYRPFGDVVDQISPIAQNKIAGTCFSQSQLIIREDAWRCQANGQFFDPCFVQMGNNKTEVICPQSPWSKESIQITVDSPLSNEHHTPLDMSRALPWAVELVNGEHCQAIDSQEVYDAMPVRYRCSNNHVLIGYLQRCKTVWSMLEKTPDGVVTAEFSRAWF